MGACFITAHYIFSSFLRTIYELYPITFGKMTAYGARDALEMALKQNTVQSASVAAALAYALCQHIGLAPHSKLLLARFVKFAMLCA